MNKGKIWFSILFALLIAINIALIFFLRGCDDIKE
jgi:hypothetical protein